VQLKGGSQCASVLLTKKNVFSDCLKQLSRQSSCQIVRSVHQIVGDSTSSYTDGSVTNVNLHPIGEKHKVSSRYPRSRHRDNNELYSHKLYS